MSRRIATLLALAASALILLSACNGATASTRTDPKDILTAALKSAQAAKSVHLEATVGGSLSIDLTGSGKATPFSLDGTSATADVDIVKRASHATFAVPALLGLSGDAIVVDGKAYLKSTLTGAQYTETDGVLDALPVDPAKPVDMTAQLSDLLARPGVDPAKGDDVGCGGKQCYTVTIDLTPLELAGLGAASATSTLPINASDATLHLVFRVEKDTDRLGGVNAVLDSPTEGKLTVDVAFSKWDEGVTIAAPPADQIKPAG